MTNEELLTENEDLKAYTTSLRHWVDRLVHRVIALEGQLNAAKAFIEQITSTRGQPSDTGSQGQVKNS